MVEWAVGVPNFCFSVWDTNITLKGKKRSHCCLPRDSTSSVEVVTGRRVSSKVSP